MPLSRKPGKLSGPLHGIPICRQGSSREQGNSDKLRLDRHQGLCAEGRLLTLVAKLKEAGAIILGKTTLPDFATSWFGYSSASGETENPVRPRPRPGGAERRYRRCDRRQSGESGYRRGHRRLHPPAGELRQFGRRARDPGPDQPQGAFPASWSFRTPPGPMGRSRQGHCHRARCHRRLRSVRIPTRAAYGDRRPQGQLHAEPRSRTA